MSARSRALRLTPAGDTTTVVTSPSSARSTTTDELDGGSMMAPDNDAQRKSRAERSLQGKTLPQAAYGSSLARSTAEKSAPPRTLSHSVEPGPSAPGHLQRVQAAPREWLTPVSSETGALDGPSHCLQHVIEVERF